MIYKPSVDPNCCPFSGAPDGWLNWDVPGLDSSYLYILEPDSSIPAAAWRDLESPRTVHGRTWQLVDGAWMVRKSSRAFVSVRWDWGGCQGGPVIPNLRRYDWRPRKIRKDSRVSYKTPTG